MIDERFGFQRLSFPNIATQHCRYRSGEAVIQDSLGRSPRNGNNKRV